MLRMSNDVPIGTGKAKRSAVKDAIASERLKERDLNMAAAPPTLTYIKWGKSTRSGYSPYTVPVATPVLFLSRFSSYIV